MVLQGIMEYPGESKKAVPYPGYILIKLPGMLPGSLTMPRETGDKLVQTKMADGVSPALIVSL